MTWNEWVASEWLLQFERLTEEGNIMDRGNGCNGWNLKILMIGLLQTCSFSLHKTLIDLLIQSWESLVYYCEVFISCLDSFWWHTFTAEDALVSKLCNDLKNLKICSTKSNKLIYLWLECEQIFILTKLLLYIWAPGAWVLLSYAFTFMHLADAFMQIFRL